MRKSDSAFWVGVVASLDNAVSVDDWLSLKIKRFACNQTRACPKLFVLTKNINTYHVFNSNICQFLSICNINLSWNKKKINCKCAQTITFPYKETDFAIKFLSFLRDLKKWETFNKNLTNQSISGKEIIRNK